MVAKQVGHEFPFDFTPLLKAEEFPIPASSGILGMPHYMLWLEGCAPASFRWRDYNGKQVGVAFKELPETPIDALALLINGLRAGTQNEAEPEPF